MRNSASKVEFEFEGLTEEQTHRFRANMEILVQQGVFNIHDGKAIIHFNYEGKIKEINFDFIKWREPKKKSVVTKPRELSILEVKRRLQSALSILEDVENLQLDSTTASTV